MRLASTVALAALLIPAVSVQAEVTRTLRAELPASELAHRVAVENLAGAMTITAGGGDTIVAVATIHAESDSVANAMRFERVIGENGAPTLRVRYPENESTFRYPKASRDESRHEPHPVAAVFENLFGWAGGGSNTKYDGRRVRVVGSGGVLAYADVQITVPKRALEAAFRNRVGAMKADGVEGNVVFDTASGGIDVAHLKGRMRADTGSGNVLATALQGTFNCDTGSGHCQISGFDGDDLQCDTGSGDVSIKDARARDVKVDTGSGDVNLTKVDAQQVDADTGSGNVELEASGTRLSRFSADTGSGNVLVRLAKDASFHAQAELSSGRVKSRFEDAEAITDDGEVIGYRRGTGGVTIRVETGSGNLVIEPAVAR